MRALIVEDGWQRGALAASRSLGRAGWDVGIGSPRPGFAAASRFSAAWHEVPPPETAAVSSVLDGETLKLADGRTVKLIGAKAPMPPLGWRGDDPLAAGG